VNNDQLLCKEGSYVMFDTNSLKFSVRSLDIILSKEHLHGWRRFHLQTVS
jgi:hypothetical protein